MLTVFSLSWLLQELDDRLLDRYSELLVNSSATPTNLTYGFLSTSMYHDKLTLTPPIQS